MPTLKIDVRTAAAGTPDLITFFVKGSPLPPGVPATEFDGAPCSTVLLRDKNQRTVVVGLGEKNKIEPDTVRRAAGAATKQLLKLGVTEVAVDMGAFGEHVGAAVEGVDPRQLQIRRLRQGPEQEDARRAGPAPDLGERKRTHRRPRAGARGRDHRDHVQHHSRHRQSPRQHAHARDPRRESAGTRAGPGADRQGLDRAPSQARRLRRHPRGRAGVGPSAAPDRARISRRRESARRRLRSSARRSRSIPAASRSSPARRWTR